jgi:hypothetical protein
MSLPWGTLKRFIVCGGRDYADADHVARVLMELPSDWTLVHGDGTGADTLAANWWRRHGRPVEAHPANWTKYGKSAGPRRNQEMADAGAEFLWAFPGGRGTADMTKRAKAAGIMVYSIEVAIGIAGP